ncbi:PRTRC system protein E [Sphingobium sp. YR657]|uniref:PRTRC system protein E n=1 Tax=Sphingobium sp. YR657 TaxID=1884366 RepID=UPI003137C63B
MLITSLLPLLSRYSLGFDLVAGPDGTVTLTIIPRKSEGNKASPEAGEVRPISITATAAEIDEELARGADGALGQLIAIRKELGDQIAEQRAAAETAKTAKTAKTAAKLKAEPAAKTPSPAAPAPSAEPAPGEPASLWD